MAAKKEMVPGTSVSLGIIKIPEKWREQSLPYLSRIQRLVADLQLRMSKDEDGLQDVHYRDLQQWWEILDNHSQKLIKHLPNELITIDFPQCYRAYQRFWDEQDMVPLVPRKAMLDLLQKKSENKRYPKLGEILVFSVANLEARIRKGT